MMAKRMRFTAEDLARTRVKTTLGVAAVTLDRLTGCGRGAGTAPRLYAAGGRR